MATPTISAITTLPPSVAISYPEKPWLFERINRIDKITSLISRSCVKAEFDEMQKYFSQYFSTCTHIVRGNRESGMRLCVYLKDSPMFALKTLEHVTPDVEKSFEYARILQFPSIEDDVEIDSEVKAVLNFTKANEYLRILKDRAGVVKVQGKDPKWKKVSDLFPGVLSPESTYPQIETYDSSTKKYLVARWKDLTGSKHRQEGSVVGISRSLVNFLSEQCDEHLQREIDAHFRNNTPRFSGVWSEISSSTPAPLPAITTSLVPKNAHTPTPQYQIKFIE